MSNHCVAQTLLPAQHVVSLGGGGPPRDLVGNLFVQSLCRDSLKRHARIPPLGGA